MGKLARYWKVIVALLTPVFVTIQTAVTDNKVTSEEWQLIIGSLVGVLFVYLAPKNKDKETVPGPRNPREW